ncbi:MAG: alpha/beta hydrolase [Epsilonproteobacteria bacterium]|nr:alpha/beta hydrolase [Campylobacterota bacterium]
MFQKIDIKVFFVLVVLILSGCSQLSKNTQPSSASPEPLFGDAVSASPSPSELPKELSSDNKKYDNLYKLYYGTNRKPKDINDISKGYSNKRAEKLYTGTCNIFIPASHKVGEVDGSLWEKIIHLDASYGKLKVKDIKGFKSVDEFWQNLRDKFKKLDKKEALIFIHGYNNSFNSSAIRAGQIGYDLKFKGVMAFYSWPSAANEFAYLSDESSIQASEKYLKEFLVGFAKKSGASKVNIIAHSMGNRGLIRVVNDIQKEEPDIHFGQIILAAPDVDADLFKHISKAYTMLSDRTTLYVSSKDKAVLLSKTFHKNPRAGLVKPVTVVDNIDTINVNIDFDNIFEKLFSLNHTYFAKEKLVLEDIRNLLDNKPDKYRKMEKNKEYKRYWKLEIK